MFEQELSLFDETYEQAESVKTEKPILTDGRHPGQVLSLVLTKTKRDDTPMIIVKFLDSDTDWEIDVPFFLTIKSIPFIKPSLLALGFPLTGKFSENLVSFCENFKIPKHVILEKKTNSKNGKDYVNYSFLVDTNTDIDNDNYNDNKIPY